MGNYLFKETEEAKQERLLQRANDYSLKLVDIQKEFQDLEKFSEIGIGEFNTHVENLKFAIGQLIQQNEIEPGHELCDVTKLEVEMKINYLVKKTNEVDRNVRDLSQMEKDVEIIFGKLRESLDSLSGQLSEEIFNAELLTDKMNNFEGIVDDLNTWFENVKESKRPEFLKEAEAENEKNQNTQIERSPESLPCDTSSDLEDKAECYMNIISSKYRLNSREISLKDIKESITNVNACWREYVKSLEEDVAEIREKSEKEIKHLKQVKNISEGSRAITNFASKEGFLPESFVPHIIIFFSLWYLLGGFRKALYSTILFYILKNLWYYGILNVVLNAIKYPVKYLWNEENRRNDGRQDGRRRKKYN